MTRVPTVAVVAASSVVPRVELDAGAERLRAEGLDVRVDPRCLSAHFTSASRAPIAGNVIRSASPGVSSESQRAMKPPADTFTTTSCSHSPFAVIARAR